MKSLLIKVSQFLIFIEVLPMWTHILFNFVLYIFLGLKKRLSLEERMSDQISWGRTFQFQIFCFGTFYILVGILNELRITSWHWFY